MQNEEAGATPQPNVDDNNNTGNGATNTEDTNKPAENLVEHTITQKEADHYPLEKQGLHIGDTVVMTEQSAKELENTLKSTSAAGRKELEEERLNKDQNPDAI